jgi:hypothetical protein
MHGDLALAQKTKPMGKSQNHLIHVNFNVFSLLFAQILLLAQVEQEAQHTPQ